MTVLSVVTVVCLGLLAGVEFAVSFLVNPVLWKLEPATQAGLVRTFARNLGGLMPYWYMLSLLLLLIASALERHRQGFPLLVAASAIWLGVIVLTLLFLVPLNNRLARLEPDAWTDQTRRQHRIWDARHRYRVAALVAALVCFALAMRI
jgi:uncharacterized membrane protein